MHGVAPLGLHPPALFRQPCPRSPAALAAAPALPALAATPSLRCAALRCAALQAGARICKTLGADFLPYLGMVMPALLASAQAKPDVAVRDADDEEEDEEDGEGGEVSGLLDCVSLRECVCLSIAAGCIA